MIEIAYYRVPGGNFGDDLNKVLWKYALPKQVFESERILLIGVGSLLNSKFLDEVLKSKRRIIAFGSGVCYGGLRSVASSIQLSALRGPLSAAMVGKSEASVTDGAALLALPQVRTALLPDVVDKNKILFMPHHDSFQFSHWDAAAKEAGIEMVDPRDSVEKILMQIASAKLIISEAMHGAIVADAFRVPWIPVTSSWRIQSFKWNDWTMSIKMPYKPAWIPSSSANDGLARHIDKRELNTAVDWRKTFETKNTEDFRNVYNRQFDREALSRAERSLARRLFGGAVKRITPVLDYVAVCRAAKSLTRLSKQAGFLSEDQVFQDRLSSLYEKADRLRAYA